ncbi:MAG: hypothetical protein HOP28_05810 [Gemmatimonadales bacterium]|nr:hypothetical protein [Gemmatimonadales bacterium]
MTTKMLRRLVPALVLATLAAACGGDGTGPSPQPDPDPAPVETAPVGTYAWQTIDGHALPYEYDSKASGSEMIRSTWLSGEIKYKADGTFTMKLVGKIVGPGYSGNPATLSYAGNWQLEAGGIKMTNGAGNAHYTSNDALATLNVNATFTLLNGTSKSMVLTFSR